MLTHAYYQNFNIKDIGQMRSQWRKSTQDHGKCYSLKYLKIPNGNGLPFQKPLIIILPNKTN